MHLSKPHKFTAQSMNLNVCKLKKNHLGSQEIPEWDAECEKIYVNI